MDVYLVSRMPKAFTDAFVERISARCCQALGEHYEPRVAEILRTGELDTVITLARNSYNPIPEMYFRDRDLSSVLSGYVVDEVDRAAMNRWIGRRVNSDDRPIRVSPGGIYSYVTVRQSDGQFFAGQSQPTLEPVYYSRTTTGVHIGNHPLLTHLASHEEDAPEIDERFFFSAINASVANDNTTPFVGCYRLAAGKGLRSHPTSLAVQVVDVQAPSYGRHRIATREQRQQAMNEELVRATSVLKRLPSGEFRVSGGKDSRMLAAFLHQADIEVMPMNDNFAEEVEGQVADRVSQVMGYSGCERRPVGEILSREGIPEATRRKIRYSGGLPSVAATQYATRNEGRRHGVPLIMGHAHLQRGGLNSVIKNAEQALKIASSRTVSHWLKSAYSEVNRNWARGVVDDVLAGGKSLQTLTYHAYMAIPVNYHLQSLFTYTRNWNLLVTPMVDERFAALCTDIADSARSRRPGEHAGITDLFYEWLAMGAIESTVPELLDFPLAGDRFRADTPERAGYERRDPALMTPRHIPAERLRGAFNTRRIDGTLRAELWEQIEPTVVRDLVKAVARPDIAKYVSEPASPPPPDVNPIHLSQFIWSVYGLSVILGTRWWIDPQG